MFYIKSQMHSGMNTGMFFFALNMNSSIICVCVNKMFLDWNIHKIRLSIDSVQFSHSIVSDSLQPRGLQHTRLACP